MNRNMLRQARYLSDIEAVQESQSEKAERLSGLVKHGIMTVDEARGELGL